MCAFMSSTCRIALPCDTRPPRVGSPRFFRPPTFGVPPHPEEPQKIFNLGGARPGRATLSFQLRRSAPPRHQFFFGQARLRSISRNAGTALPAPTRLIAHPAWAEVGHFINSAPPEKMRKSPALLRILSAGIGCTPRPGRMHILTRNPGPGSAKGWAGCASCPGI